LRLLEQGRATRAQNAGTTYWVAAERAKTFSLLFPGARFDRDVPEIQNALPSSDDALLALVTCWMSHLGPATTSQLGELLGLPPSEIEKALLRMEASGAVLRGQFTDQTSRASRPRPHEHGPELEWCERRLLARIHRLTVATLRKQIEPVTAAQFMRWLLRWQHVASGAQVQGERATLEVLRQLQGFEIPANAWERQILGRRIINYDPKWLDQLCLTGAVGWGRLSPHPATLDDTAAGKRRVIPTSVAPITFSCAKKPTG
jgi:ATP-dependent Lhr-like helicase